MSSEFYLPIYETTRGTSVESTHFGAVAVVAASGKLIASFGDPRTKTFIRSSAKPFQALPFIEAGGADLFRLIPAEVALICASHSGTDKHIRIVTALQSKVGVSESDLQCGLHPPYDRPTRDRLRAQGESPTSNRNNCSGKHTGMLAFAQMNAWPSDDYLNPDHPLQKAILDSFSQMAGLPPSDIDIGIDGCSAPNFGLPLYNAALAYARITDPSSLPPRRAAACHTITSAMLSHPEMVAGPNRFDSRLMQVAAGRILSKGGAEGYQAIALLPGALGPDTPALGIAIKISDGDQAERARSSAALEVLRQLEALSQNQLAELSAFGPSISIQNLRQLTIGEGRPTFTLKRN